MKTTRMCRRLVALAGLAAIAASASALSVDPQITIDRALNSPTLAVRYTGVTATLVELRINGQSVGTREVSGGKSLGETNFTIDLDSLKNGDNLVEIRLFDRTGKLVAGDKTNISMEKSARRGPVFVAAPKEGSTVMGPVEINVGFGQNLGKSYVSFFVDGKFQSLTNFPPFTFMWDTEKEANGWHDIEAWAIDERNETHKTGAVKLFVNNPGGRTNRVGVAPTAVVPTRNVSRDHALVGADAGLRALGMASSAVRVKSGPPQSLPPAVVERMVPISNAVRAAVSGANGLRPVVLASALATGPKSLMPTGRRVAKAPTVAIPVVKTAVVTTPTTKAAVVQPPAVQPTAIQAANGAAVITATTMVSVVTGTKLPSLGAYLLLLDGQPVRFDVPTRVENGVALAPLRSIVEKAGGKVVWDHKAKTARAGLGGHEINLTIGVLAGRIDGKNLILEKAPGLDRGRTIVPLSLLHDALGMDVQYDKTTGNVVVSTKK